MLSHLSHLVLINYFYLLWACKVFRLLLQALMYIYTRCTAGFGLLLTLFLADPLPSSGLSTDFQGKQVWLVSPDPALAVQPNIFHLTTLSLEYF